MQDPPNRAQADPPEPAKPDGSPPQPASPARKLSRKRLLANRRNAQKSTGPRTPEGKAICRQNALKHGLTGAGVVVHPEDQELLRTRLHDWTDDLQPADGFEGWLVGRIVLASVRLDRCTKVDQAATHDRVGLAVHEWTERERTLVHAHGELLPYKPAKAVALLQATSFGCEWLLHQWAELRQTLQAGRWSRAHTTQALHLLGQAQPPTNGSPDAVKAFWSAAQAAEAGRDAGAAREPLMKLLDAEVARLQALGGRLWTEQDAPVRQRVADRALFDASEAGERMRRYEKASAAELHRHLTALVQKQTREARARAQMVDRQAERREVVRAVVSLLKRRKARRAAAAAAATTPAATTAAAPSASSEPCVRPRPLAERLGAAVAPGSAVAVPVAPAVAARENRPTGVQESVQLSGASTACVGAAAPGSVPAGPGAVIPPAAAAGG